MKYIAVLLLLSSILLVQNKPDEQDYISATEYFNSNLNILTGNNSSLAFEIFEQIKNRYNKIITDYSTSDLKDDAQLAIAVAAGRLNDIDIFTREVEKIFTDFPGGRITYLNFTNPTCNTLLPAVQSTFVETDAYAQYLLGMAYFSTSLIPSVQDYNIAIAMFEKVINDFPLSLMAAYSQYYIARAYDYLLYIDRYENNFVIEQYEIVTDKYYDYSHELAEDAFGRIGDFITLNGPAEKYDYFNDRIKNIYTDENYIAESRFQNKKNLRWTDISINIYLTGSLPLTGADSSVALAAAGAYAAASGNILDFNFIAQENLANIILSFSPSVGNFTQTFTKKKDDQISEITSAKIYLKTSGEIEKRKEIALHEMGHALGLDHSFNSKDNMFFLGNGSNTLSQRDVKTLEALYSYENIAPMLLSTLYTPRIKPGERLFFDLDAQDLDKGIPEFSLIGATPGWLEINPVSGVLQGTPTDIDSGYYNLAVRLSDAHGAVTDYNWKFLVSNNKSFTGITSAPPPGFELVKNYPNPFNCSTIINFELNKSAEVKLEVINTLGEKIIELFNGRLTEGKHSFKFNAENLPSGVYFYRIFIDNKLSKIKKMLLLK